MQTGGRSQCTMPSLVCGRGKFARSDAEKPGCFVPKQNMKWVLALQCNQSIGRLMAIMESQSHCLSLRLGQFCLPQCDQVAQCAVKEKPHPPLRIYVEPDQVTLVSLDTAFQCRMKKGKRVF